MRQSYIGSRSYVKIGRRDGARDRYTIWSLDAGNWILESENPDDETGTDKGIVKIAAENLMISLIQKGYKVVEIRPMNKYR